MTKDNTKQLSSYHNHYYFVAAALATTIAGIVHLYMPLSHPMMLRLSPITIFFLGSGIAQIFWVLPMIKRWGKPWYFVGVAGNIAFIILYVVTRFPGNPVTGRGGNTDIIDLTCELAQAAYIIITVMILAKERTIKVSQKELPR
jgi:hypothetical protein